MADDLSDRVKELTRINEARDERVEGSRIPRVTLRKTWHCNPEDGILGFLKKIFRRGDS